MQEMLMLLLLLLSPIHHTKLYAKMFYKGNLTYEPKFVIESPQ